MILDLTLFSLVCISLAGIFVGLITLIANRYERPNNKGAVIKIAEATFKNNANKKN